LATDRFVLTRSIVEDVLFTTCLGKRMRIVDDATERDMAWEWAIAEVESSRFGGGYAGLDPRIRSVLAKGVKEDLSPRELDLVTKAVRNVRRPILEDLIQFGTEWKEAQLELDEVGALRVVNWPPLVDIGPSRTIGGIARFLDRGGVPPRDPAFGENYRMLRSGFDQAKLRGKPILVSDEDGGPFEVLEGYTRLSVIASKHAAGEMGHVPIPVIAGFTPRLREWCLWQPVGGRWDRTQHHMM
jgi:hypothetical protein